jgi:hypothetical protein
MNDLASIWIATLQQLQQHIPAEILNRLQTDCHLISVDHNGSGPAVVTLGVTELDTLSLVKHKLPHHLVTYLGVITEHPVDLNIKYTGSGEPAQRNFLKVMSAHHILSSKWPDPIWIIPDLLPTGLTLLAGKSTVGKSWLALQICKYLAYGEKLWGKDVQAGKFLYLALEDTPRRLAYRMKKQNWPTQDILKSSGFILKDAFEHQIGYLDEEGSRILAEQIDHQKPRLVVIDTLGRAIRGDHNDYDIMTTALSPIQQVALAKNIVILMLDHHRKSFNGIDIVADVLGSTAKSAVADTIWGFYRRDGQNQLGIIGRDIADSQLALTFDETCQWQLASPAAIEITPRRQEILDAIEDLGSPTLADISAAIQQNRGNTYTRLQDLLDAGLIHRQAASGQATIYTLKGKTNV